MPAAKRFQAHEVFRAFSDPTRLRILHLLQSGELCVGDIVAVLRIPQPTASRHLSSLRRAGLVSTRKHQQWIHYALGPASHTLHEALLASLQHCADGLPDLKVDAGRLKALRKRGGCCP